MNHPEFILKPEELEILESAQALARKGLSWKEGEPLPKGLVSEVAKPYIMEAPKLFILLLSVLQDVQTAA